MLNRKKNQEKVEKNEYFLKICLTNDEKMNIYIGWPNIENQERVVNILGVLLNGVINGLFTEQIIKTMKEFDNPTINSALAKIPKLKTNYVSPMDVL